jgi:regulator of protease activity HflC (stomatin/prohibitin superfamily)
MERTTNGMLTIEQIKEAIKAKENVVGMTFVNSRGAQGVVLEALSPRGKRQAEMTCVAVQGCTETHIREQSDWHQSYACRTHSRPRNKSGGTGNGPSGIRLDNGVVVRYMEVQDSDDNETRALKEQNNALYESMKAKRDAEAKARREQREAERKAKLEANRAERLKKHEAEKKAKLADTLKRIKEYAAKMNIPVSDAALQQVEPEAV